MKLQKYNISIASDHHGVVAKSQIINLLQSMDYNIIDLGPNSSTSVDYPDYAQKVCESILNEQATYGILLCGTGVGMSIAANRHSYIRAALCTNVFMAERSRAHNNANILVLGAEIIEQSEMLEMVKKFLSTSFEGGRHAQRLAKIR